MDDCGNVSPSIRLRLRCHLAVPLVLLLVAPAFKSGPHRCERLFERLYPWCQVVRCDLLSPGSTNLLHERVASLAPVAEPTCDNPAGFIYLPLPQVDHHQRGAKSLLGRRCCVVLAHCQNPVVVADSLEGL